MKYSKEYKPAYHKKICSIVYRKINRKLIIENEKKLHIARQNILSGLNKAGSICVK